MNYLFPIIVGSLFGSGIFLLMERSLFRLILGIALLGHAANLFIFSIGGYSLFAAPIIPAGSTELQFPYSDPVPAALILTSIVIGLGVQAFLIALVIKTSAVAKTSDLDQMGEERL